MKRVLLFAGLCCALISLQTTPADAKSSTNAIAVHKTPFDGDLILENFYVQVVSPSELNFMFTVNNTGTEDVSNLSFNITFSEDNILGNTDDYRIYEVRDPQDIFVPAGQTSTVSYRMYLTKGYYAPVGTWHVIAMINFEEVIPESNFSNNVKEASPLTVVSPYDIELEVPPTLVDVTGTSARISYTPDTDQSAAYWLAVPASSPAPTLRDILIDGTGMVAIPGYDIEVSSLTPGTDYKIYVVFDYFGGNYSKIYPFSASTIATPPFTFSNPPTIESYTSDRVTIKFNADPNMWQIHYLVTEHSNDPDDMMMMIAPYVNGEDTLLTIDGLSPNKNHYIYLCGRSYTDEHTEVYVLHFSTQKPAASPNYSEIVFEPMATNGAPNVFRFTVTAWDLMDDVDVTVEGGFLVSRDSVVFADHVTLLKSDLPFGTMFPLFLKPASTNHEEKLTGKITITSDGADSFEVPVSAQFYPTTTSNFNDITSLSEAGWQSQSATGSQQWELSDQAGPSGRIASGNKVARIDGAEGGAEVNEDWLITPAMDLSDFTGVPQLSFYSKSSGQGPSLKLRYSTNYVLGAPSTATWTELDGQFSEANSNTWKQSLVTITKGENVHIAFVYYSTATEASTWSIDDWKVIDAVPAAIEKESRVAFSTYPNPTSGNVSIEWRVPVSANVAVKVMSEQGVVVKTFRSTSNDLGVGLSAFLENAPAGVYQVHIADGARSYVTRVVRK